MDGNQHRYVLTTAEEAVVRDRVEQNTHDPQLRVQLALHCWHSGELVEAIEWIDSCLQIDPSNINYYRVRANVFVDMGHTAKAVEVGCRAMEIAPDNVQARILTIRMLLADLKPARAQEILDVAMTLKPEHQQLHHMKSLQQQILNMTRQSEHDPVKWLSRKLANRISNVAGED